MPLISQDFGGFFIIDAGLRPEKIFLKNPRRLILAPLRRIKHKAHFSFLPLA